MSEKFMFNYINDYYGKNVGIEIREQSELLESEIELLQQAGLYNYANMQSWTALGTNQQLAYSSHGIFRYFGKFPPPVATYLINKFTIENDIVCDPMCGSGTTGVESLLLNRKCIVNDINPLSILLAKVKTTYLPEEILMKKLNFINEKYKPMTIEEYDFIPVALRDPDHWFLEETSNSLRGIKFLIEQETNVDVKNFLNVIMAATVRRVSRATTQQGRLFLDVETAVPDALATFEKRYLIGIKGVSKLPENRNIKYYQNDLKELASNEFKEIAQLVILHPPYFNSYKYSSVNSLETGWLGYNRNEYNKAEVKEFFKVGKPDNYVRYVNDMFLALNNALSMLRLGGMLGLMIGDTIMKNQHIQVTKMLLDKIDRNKYSIETIALRVPKYTEATWVASQRRKSDNVGITLYDYIILIKRTN